MPYIRLGNSGLKVSKIILGTMQYGTPDWQQWVLGEEEAIKHTKTAYDAGIQTFDTADMYSNGLSEVVLGKAIKELELPRDEIVVMAKFYNVVAREYGTMFLRSGKNPDEEGYINQRGLSRKYIFQAVKHSLERLQLDYIDLLQCHRFDNDTPIEETMQALRDVVKAGYVRYIGMSSCWAWQLHAMQNYAIQNNLTPFILMEEEREMFPTLKMYFGIGSIPWSPLARGFLARPLAETTKRASSDFYIGRYAEATGTHDILESLKKLEDIIGGINVKLTDDEIKYLEEPYQPQAIIGHM
ncbi:NADP-dependent oxidoreductase domain-containing protein [Cyathus striatus]|nr:NADP-dependent oxidoreductase domain-containing protein [Cyathus striatus]